MIAVSAKGLVKTYDSKTKALDDVSLEIEKGAICGLIGRNGAGKTTLLKALLGLVSLDCGTVEIGVPRREVGFLVDGPTLYGAMSVRKNLELCAKLRQCSKASLQRAMEISEVSRFEHKMGKELSAGMRQRVGIAAAIMGNPKLIILDEPSQGLDPQGLYDLRQMLTHINEDLGSTIILSSHMLGELEKIITCCAIMREGTLKMTEVKTDLEKALLGV